jgi:hypothetical protein
VLGVQNDQIITIPFFATPRVNAGTVSMATQTDSPNVQPSIPPDPLGAEVHTFFGCWLDINQTSAQPNALRFPSLVVGDAAGPFNSEGPLLPIQSFAATTNASSLRSLTIRIPSPSARIPQIPTNWRNAISRL